MQELVGVQVMKSCFRGSNVGWVVKEYLFLIFYVNLLIYCCLWDRIIKLVAMKKVMPGDKEG